jgi:colicin import membrane protein
MRASRRFRHFAVAAVVAGGAIAAIAGAWAQPNEDPQARLRSALREATVRVRQLEDENATLLAKQAELERDHQALSQKAATSEKGLQALRGQAASGQAALQRTADAQKESLAKWEAAYKEAASTAQARDADAKRMEAALVVLREQNRLAEEKNAKLYQLGQELLDLYQNKKVLDVLGAGEPVTKLKRVEYENVVQDYEDKLRDSHMTHPAPR